MSGTPSKYGLENHGLVGLKEIHWNLNAEELYEQAVCREEGIVARGGPLVVNTAPHTGRSPNDKYIVRESSNADKVWWGKVNQPMAPERFAALRSRLVDYLRNREVFVQDLFIGADPENRLPVRVITELAWHSLFARYMFVRPKPEDLARHVPEFTVITIPTFHSDPKVDGTRSETVIAVNFGEKTVIIGGTFYAGETKKSVFTLMNYLLPVRNVLSMHCSANYGKKGDTALFFGLSGTGKTTLSADPERTLIGDDEHGWSDNGVFNFEGGCYAKVIKLSREAEPEIFATTERFGTLLENVVVDPVTRSLDLNDASITENTRASYPIDFIANATLDGIGGHPANIVFLTADAYGVMPPIASLTRDQAMYHFLSGYTARVAGTEKGLKEPQATFSTCFGSPFLVLNPKVYAHLLGEKIDKHNAQVWLVNTGWSGGPYGMGKRMKIQYTRAMIHAALSGALNDVPMTVDPIFGVHIPTKCPDVPADVLIPSNTWEDTKAYDAMAKKLAREFGQNFEQFAKQVAEGVRAAGPKMV
jgi:phosphoenolpyruvate carboxykinase (ATP)